jgi:hypothetical protein
MSFHKVAKVLFVDDSTIRAWRKAYAEGGGTRRPLHLDFKGGFSPRSDG